MLVPLVGGLAFAASPSTAVRVRIEGAPSSVAVILVASSGEDEVTARGAAGDRLELSLATGRLWTVQPRAAGYWAPRLALHVSSGVPLEATVHLWPAGVLKGSVRMPKGEERPPTIRLRFRPLPDALPDGAPEGEVDCPVGRDGVFACRIPEGRWDLRVRATGYVSHYFWDAKLSGATARDLGVLPLRRGGSVVGFVAAEGRDIRLQECTVALKTPAAGIQSPEGEARAKGLTVSVHPNQRGFFHLDGVAPGLYELVAWGPLLGPERIFPLQVVENAESEVRPAVLLRRPAQLEVQVEPPLDPWGRPWQVDVVEWRLEKPIPGKAAGGCTEAGVLRAELPRGRYQIEVRDPERSVWGTQLVDLEGGSELARIELDLLPVEGTVQLGDQPLAADLIFTEHPAELNTGTIPEGEEDRPLRRIKLLSAADGTFAGWLPEEGTYSVVVDARDPDLRRKISGVHVRKGSTAHAARVDIELPDTRLAGTVVDADGHSAAGVRVDVVALSIAGWEKVFSEDDGTFEVIGVAPDTYRLTATEGDLASDPLQVTVTDKRSIDHLRLVLRKRQTLRGVVLDGAGPVPAALVDAIIGGKVEQATSDVDGSFELDITGDGPQIAALAVLATGRALHLQRVVAASGSDPIVVHLSSATARLRIVPPASGYGPGGATAIALVGPGGIAMGSTLQRWVQLHGLPSLIGSEGAVVPAVEPGPYTACIVKMQEASQLLPAMMGDPVMAVSTWAAANPVACATGVVSDGTELTLKLPER